MACAACQALHATAMWLQHSINTAAAACPPHLPTPPDQPTCPTHLANPPAQCTPQVPQDAYELNLVFSNADGSVWDNHAGADFFAPVKTLGQQLREAGAEGGTSARGSGVLEIEAAAGAGLAGASCCTADAALAGASPAVLRMAPTTAQQTRVLLIAAFPFPLCARAAGGPPQLPDSAEQLRAAALAELAAPADATASASAQSLYFTVPKTPLAGAPAVLYFNRKCVVAHAVQHLHNCCSAGTRAQAPGGSGEGGAQLTQQVPPSCAAGPMTSH